MKKIIPILALLSLPALAQTGIPAPPDVAAPPADAQKTASGLASKVLAPGTGTCTPVRATTSRSTTRAGPPTARCSTPRSRAASRSPSRWTRSSRAGPRAAAHGRGREAPLLDPREPRLRGRPGAPQGMLVFDVELLDVLRRRRPRRRTWPRRPPTPRRPSPVSPPRCSARHRHRHAEERTAGRRSTTRAGPPTARCSTPRSRGSDRPSSSSTGHPRLDRGAAAHGRRREAPLLDPEEARLPRSPGKPEGMLVFDVELLEIVRP